MNDEITFCLTYRPPFEAATLLTYLGNRAIRGIEEVTARGYRRTIGLPHSQGIVELELLATDTILARAWSIHQNDLTLLEECCRQIFDLDAEPAAINQVLAADSPRLKL
jgi:AraC family transcriptional regulator of adaptative response / DNA-3-methyladenine glycosylase II